MRIGGISNALTNHITSAQLSKNNSSDKHESPLQKQKAQIQNQISQVEESSLPKEVKDAKIKALQENLQEVEQKESEEKAQKKLEDPKIKNTDKKLKSEDDENNQPINNDVIYGMVSASTHMKIAKTALSVYKKAKAKGDTGVMQRALSYAAPELKKSSESTKLISKGISEYKKQISIVKKDAAANKNSTDTTVKIQTDDTVREKVVISKLA
jgi:hypothetical protein